MQMLAIDFDTNQDVRLATAEEIYEFADRLTRDPWAVISIDGRRCYLVPVV